MTKGGLSREEIRQQLKEADAALTVKGNTFPSRFAMWGLDEEVRSWGYEMPSGEQLCHALFTDEPIEWNRIGACA